MNQVIVVQDVIVNGGMIKKEEIMSICIDCCVICDRKTELFETTEKCVICTRLDNIEEILTILEEKLSKTNER